MNKQYGFSNNEFKNLPRNKDGDLIDITPLYFTLPTAQYDMLSEDDTSRYEECQEEMRILREEAKHEFA